MTVVNEKGNHEKINKPERPEAAAKAEKVDVRGASEVMQATADVAAEVADLGIEDAEASEGFREEGRQKAKHTTTSSKKSDPAAAQIKTHIPQKISEKRMQKEIAREVRKEIRREERKVLLAYAGIKSISPHRLAELVAKIRSLRDLLASLLQATKEVLTGLYLKWVRKES